MVVASNQDLKELFRLSAIAFAAGSMAWTIASVWTPFWEAWAVMAYGVAVGLIAAIILLGHRLTRIKLGYLGIFVPLLVKDIMERTIEAPAMAGLWYAGTWIVTWGLISMLSCRILLKRREREGDGAPPEGGAKTILQA